MKILDKELYRLKKYILPLDFKPCSYVSDKSYKDILPLSYKNDLNKICTLYSVKFIIKKGKFRCCYIRLFNMILMQDENVFTPKDICQIFCHELAHHIQYISKSYLCNWNTFKERLIYERMACRLAYFIYKAYFIHLEKLTRYDFILYRSKSNIEFLKKKHFKIYNI